MDSIGETLRAARHNKKASIEDAARATRVKTDILEKLEADELSRIGAPAYTKGFLKLYAEYLGLDSQSLVQAYVTSQGGLRRQGLRLETEAAVRARKPNELHLPLRSVVLVVAALTAVVVAVLVGQSLFHRYARSHPKSAVAASHPPLRVILPKPDVEAWYQPKTKPEPELLEVPAK